MKKGSFVWLLYIVYMVLCLPGVLHDLHRLAQGRRLGSRLARQIDGIRHQALHIRLLAGLHGLIVGIARVEVGAAPLSVGLAAIRPEDRIRRHTSRALARLGSRLGVRRGPLLALALDLARADPLSRLLRIAATAARGALEGTSLRIGVDALALVHLVRLELVGAVLVGRLTLHEAGEGLLRSLRSELLHLLLVDEVAPGLAHEARLVHLLNELGHHVAAAHEGVAAAWDSQASEIAAVAGGGGGGAGRDSHLE